MLGEKISRAPPTDSELETTIKDVLYETFRAERLMPKPLSTFRELLAS